MDIETVDEAGLSVLLPLMRGYCDFYEVDPPDVDLLAMARALIADPDGEGFQLLARDGDRAVGYATVCWGWATLSASRDAVLHDLYVHPDARGSGVATALIAACGRRAARGGAATLGWQTAGDNHAAQRVYARVGAQREQWVDYVLDLDPAVSA